MLRDNILIPEHYEPKFWSDGIDNDRYANIIRAGLLSYFESVYQSSKSSNPRKIKAAYLVKTDPPAAKALLQSGKAEDGYGNVSATTLYEMEQEGLIPKTSTDADLLYWAEMTEGTHDAQPYRHRVIEIVTARNGRPVSMSGTRPTVAQVYSGGDATDLFADVPLPDAPLNFRALASPDGKPLFVQLCPSQDEALHFWEDNPEIGKLLRLKIKTLPPVMQDGKAVYGWIRLPGPYKDPQTGKVSFGWAKPDTCGQDLELKEAPAPPLQPSPERAPQ